MVVIAVVAFPTHTVAQAGFVVGGRVVEGGDRGIQNAIVELEGHGPVLTSAEGVFRLEGVEAGEYILQVEAFGYVPSMRTVFVRRDTTLIVDLAVSPFLLDSLVVAPRRTDIAGHIRDAERDFSVRGADVLTSQGHLTRSNGRGRFELDVWEGIKVLVQVRAFGYLPVDTLLVPTEDAEYLIELVEDPVVVRMIETQTKRLEERAGGRLAITMRPLNRKDLLRWRGATLDYVLLAEYRHRVDRVGCVLVDERALTPGLSEGVLRTTMARDVVRIEFLFGGQMLRVYTREFMRRMVGGGLELRRPTFSGMARPPLCT